MTVVLKESLTSVKPQLESVKPELESVEPGRPYDTLLARADTILDFIIDGTLDPEEGLAATVWPTRGESSMLEAVREFEERRARRRFTPEVRARAVALVAGGASYRVAASAVLGSERFYVSVWRWARVKGQQ